MSGLSWTELHQLTWEQLIFIFEKSIDHQVNYVIPLAYKAEPKPIFDYLVKRQTENVKNQISSKADFKKRFEKMKKMSKQNGPLTANLKQQMRNLKKFM